MRKFVVIAAPHTSNWDFVIFLAVAHHFRIRARVLGKHTLVRWPFGSLMRKLGVIPVRRDTGHGLVDQIAAVFTASDELALTITPEGTRSAVTHWRSGFYRIALAAGVPIILAFIDGDEKTAGLGPTLDPSGDLDRDMSTIRDFYGSIPRDQTGAAGADSAAPGDGCRFRHIGDFRPCPPFGGCR